MDKLLKNCFGNCFGIGLKSVLETMLKTMLNPGRLQLRRRLEKRYRARHERNNWIVRLLSDGRDTDSVACNGLRNSIHNAGKDGAATKRRQNLSRKRPGTHAVLDGDVEFKRRHIHGPGIPLRSLP